MSLITKFGVVSVHDNTLTDGSKTYSVLLPVANAMPPTCVIFECVDQWSAHTLAMTLHEKTVGVEVHRM